MKLLVNVEISLNAMYLVFFFNVSVLEGTCSLFLYKTVMEENQFSSGTNDLREILDIKCILCCSIEKCQLNLVNTYANLPE